MQALKIIGIIVCFIFAFNFALCFWFDTDFVGMPFLILAILFALACWYLISKVKFPISWKDKALAALFIVFLFGFIITIVIPNYVKACYESSQNACVNNLRQLQAGKMEWALETGATNGALVTESDITPYIQLDLKGHIPPCPIGGTYIIGRVGEDVKCSIGTSNWPYRHVLSDTNNFTWWEDFKGAYGVLFGFRHVPKPD